MGDGVIGERQLCTQRRLAGSGGKLLGGHRLEFSCSCQRILPGAALRDLVACRYKGRMLLCATDETCRIGAIAGRLLYK